MTTAVISGLGCLVAIGASPLWRHRGIWEAARLSRHRARFRGQVIGVLGDGTLQVVSQPILRRLVLAPFVDAADVDSNAIVDVRVAGAEFSQRPGRLWLKQRVQHGIRSVRFEALAWEPAPLAGHREPLDNEASFGAGHLGRPTLLCRVSRRPSVLWPVMTDVGEEAARRGAARVRSAEQLLDAVAGGAVRCGASEGGEREAASGVRASLAEIKASLAREEAEVKDTTSTRSACGRAGSGGGGPAAAQTCAVQRAWKLWQRRDLPHGGKTQETGPASPSVGVGDPALLDAVAKRFPPSVCPLLNQHQTLAAAAAAWEDELGRRQAGLRGVVSRAIASTWGRLRPSRRSLHRV